MKAYLYCTKAKPYLIDDMDVFPEQCKEEHDYLKDVIRPFKDRVKKITKLPLSFRKSETILIEVSYPADEEDTTISFLPPFLEGTMYKGMILRKPYKLEELGL